MTLAIVPAWAETSDDGVYRYLLGRRWDYGPTLRWIMLNPSTADAEVDDPTIRRVVHFTRDAGYSAATVANLYALRATNPRELDRHPNPIGPGNDITLRSLSYQARYAGSPVVLAWGARAPLRRALHVLSLIGVTRLCLGLTKNGQPRHPLYVPADQPLIHFLMVRP